jgi:hypothetical protein
MTKVNPGEKNYRNILKAQKRFAPKPQRSRLTYAAAVAMFAETEDCTPIQRVAAHRRCRQIARQFSKTPEDVANDINRVYLASYSQILVSG